LVGFAFALAVACRLLVSPAGSWAAPFSDYFAFTQPDGAELTLWGVGDDFHAVFETTTGHTVIFDPARRAYFYAERAADGSSLVATGVPAHEPAPPSLGRHVRMDPAAAAAAARARQRAWDAATGLSRRWSQLKAQTLGTPQMPGAAIALPAPPGTTTTGAKSGLTLLIDFSDAPATISQAEIEAFLNGDSYAGFGNNGSVKQYFSDVSATRLNYTNVVTIYIRMALPKSYYNDTSKDCGAQAQLLIGDALDILKARSDYADTILPTFEPLTTDGSGRVAAFNVFFAGGNSHAWSYGLWPHSWSLASPVPLGNGKSVFRYQITNIGTALSLGTFCHENGHMLCGFPDIYDYDYDSVGGAGDYCLMDYGGSGTNPRQVSAYLKLAAGWATATDLYGSSNLTGTLVAAPDSGYDRVYRYRRPGVATEYFLFENRQKAGRDAGLRSAGIAAWHIDELGDKNNQNLTPNTSHLNYEVTLEQADNLWHFQNDVNSGDAYDLYYQGNGAAAYTNCFNDASGPSANWWDGSSSGLKLGSFSASGMSMTFRVEAGAPPTVTVIATSPTATEAGPTPGQFTVSRTGGTSEALVVRYAVTGTATPGDDYAPLSGSVTIGAGSDTATVAVLPVNDTTVESDETVVAAISADAAYVAGSPAIAAVRIWSDDGSPATIRLGSAVLSVGESRPTVAITATRSGGSSGGCGASYATANGTAAAGSDYTAASGTLIWADGDMADKSFTVSITNDALDEPNETFTATLSAPLGVATLGSPSSGTVTITDNDPTPTVGFGQASSSVLESTTPATIGVSLSAASGRTVKVNYATANGTAVAGSDYTATSGTLTFAPGATSRTIAVPIADDAARESDETFRVTLAAPVNAAPGAIATHTCSIHDADVPGLEGFRAVADAVDQEGWAFAAAGGVDWWWQTAVAHDGSDAARSGRIADDQTSSLETTGVFDAGTATFWWKVSSEAGFDFLRFSIDGVVQDAIAGEVGWVQQSYPVAAGIHTLKWEYSKDGSGSSGIDAAWLDQVVLPAALLLWTRGDTGEANLWAVRPGTTPGALPGSSWIALTVPSGEGGAWEASSCAHGDATAEYVLWTSSETGQAILARVNPAAPAGVSPVASWAYLKAPAGVGGPWQATSYTHVDAATGYVLWTRGDTGQAILWKVVPGAVSGTIPVASWAYLQVPAGVGGPWQATSYTHVDAATGYVLWTRGGSGQAILWKVAPGAVSGTIPVTSWAYLHSPAGVGAPWQATGYLHVDDSEGYVLWTRGDTGQAILWQVVPGAVSGTIPVTSWAYVSPTAGAGEPWRATSLAHGAMPGSPAAGVAAPLGEAQQSDARSGADRRQGNGQPPPGGEVLSAFPP
jgi:M6 family metalloprotease-like protein